MKESVKITIPGFIAIAAIGFSLQLTSTKLVAQSADQYIGSESCAACHPQQYEAWQLSAHSRASAVLPENHRLDKRCMQCHSTLAPNVDPSAPAGIANISCERCHGPGKYYAANNVMKDPELRSLVGLRQPDDKMCTICHSDASPSVRSFDYATFINRIHHGKSQSQPANNKPASNK